MNEACSPKRQSEAEMTLVKASDISMRAEHITEQLHLRLEKYIPQNVVSKDVLQKGLNPTQAASPYFSEVNACLDKIGRHIDSLFQLLNEVEL